MDLHLPGRKAIITGGSRGIGLAIASHLAAEKVDVAICARNQEQIDVAVGQLAAQGVRAFGGSVDVSDADTYRAWLASAIAELGGLDIFVANVALPAQGGGDASWYTPFDIDLMHAVRGLEAVEGALAASDAGSVVLISSVSANLNEVEPGGEAYGALKAAMVSYMSQKAQHLGPQGTRVNAVSPGPIYFEGGFWAEVEEEDPETFAFVSELAALGRMGTDVEVARLVTFLASPAAGYITGANVRIDGGAVKSVNF